MCQKVHGISILEEDECYFLVLLLLFTNLYHLPTYSSLIHSIRICTKYVCRYIFIHLLQSWHLLDTLGSFLYTIVSTYIYVVICIHFGKTFFYLFSYTHSNCLRKIKEESKKIISLKNKHKSPGFHVFFFYFSLYLLLLASWKIYSTKMYKVSTI